MAQKSDAQLTTDANVIGNETTPGANTADRVRDHLVDIIDSKVNNDEAVALLISDTAYDATSWNGVTDVAPSKNAVRDKIESMGTNVGAQDLFIPAAAMWPRASNGCSTLTPNEMATSQLTIQSLDFDQTADEYAHIHFAFPRNFNNGTIVVTVYWTAITGSGTVQWEVSAAAYSNDDPLTGTFGTAVAIDDTLIATNDLHISPTSSAITIGGSPADGDLVAIQIMRDVSDDTLTADAKLLGIRITLTLDAATSE